MKRGYGIYDHFTELRQQIPLVVFTNVLRIGVFVNVFCEYHLKR